MKTYKSEDGVVTILDSMLEQRNGVWYIVFEATEFSPFALVVRYSGDYDETAGVPYYLDSDGNKIFIGFAAKGKYIVKKDVVVYVAQNDKSFTDISGHWAEGYIGFVTEREIFLGTGESTFSPNKEMTRAMFATVIGRLYERSYGEIETTGNKAFTDCDYDAYYGKYVDWAAKTASSPDTVTVALVPMTRSPASRWLSSCTASQTSSVFCRIIWILSSTIPMQTIFRNTRRWQRCSARLQESSVAGPVAYLLRRKQPPALKSRR